MDGRMKKACQAEHGWRITKPLSAVSCDNVASRETPELHESITIRCRQSFQPRQMLEDLLNALLGGSPGQLAGVKGRT